MLTWENEAKIMPAKAMCVCERELVKHVITNTHTSNHLDTIHHTPYVLQ